MSVAYQKLHERYRVAAAAKLAERRGKAHVDGSTDTDTAKIMNEIRQAERESARNGVVLSAIYQGDRVKVETQNVPTKRSLQEEYCRKFDNEAQVDLNGKKQTLRQYHEKRLLGR